MLAYLWRRQISRRVSHTQRRCRLVSPSRSGRWASGSYLEPCSCAPARTTDPEGITSLEWGALNKFSFFRQHSLKKTTVCSRQRDICLGALCQVLYLHYVKWISAVWSIPNVPYINFLLYFDSLVSLSFSMLDILLLFSCLFFAPWFCQHLYLVVSAGTCR